MPDVVTMSFDEAAARLEHAGFVPQGSFEYTPVGDATGVDPVLRQSVAPAEIAACGTVIDLTVPYQPGPLYAIRSGDTYASVASSLAISPQDLLTYNGLTEADIARNGQTIDTPLEAGSALRTTPLVPHDGS